MERHFTDEELDGTILYGRTLKVRPSHALV